MYCTFLFSMQEKAQGILHIMKYDLLCCVRKELWNDDLNCFGPSQKSQSDIPWMVAFYGQFFNRSRLIFFNLNLMENFIPWNDISYKLDENLFLKNSQHIFLSVISKTFFQQMFCFPADMSFSLYLMSIYNSFSSLLLRLSRISVETEVRGVFLIIRIRILFILFILLSSIQFK